MMSGIYIHIPFCKKACHYCDFHFSTLLEDQSKMVDAIQKELLLRKNEWTDTPVSTIYFGGGTPSLLSEKELTVLINCIYEHGNVISQPEITLEANPDDLSPEKLLQLKRAGINRLSIGVQSLDEKVLQWMNRSHCVDQAYQSIQDAQNSGFDNISVDLIYGHPFLTPEKWEHTIRQILDWKVQHISAYALTIEPNTVFGHRHQKGQLEALSDEAMAQQFQQLNDLLKASGFIHYEVSNWAQPNHISQHNSSYWKSLNYLGVGPSAHSFDGKHRRWNLANNPQYIKKVQTGENDFYEVEKLSLANQFNEYLMIGLRTYWGCDKKVLQSFGSTAMKVFEDNRQKSTFSQYLQEDEHKIFIRESDWIWADRVAGELFWVG